MLSREEYEDGIIRMYDSIRSSMHKGKGDCEGVSCVDCPLNVNGVCDDAANAFDMIEVVENWVKEHPIKTNSKKFEEVFGFKPFTNACVKGEIKCKDCEYNDYGVCNASRFWNAEYNEKTKEGEE